MKTQSLTPTRHGNWEIINGKLVDVPVAASPVAKKETPVAEPAAEQAPEHSAHKRRGLHRSE